MIKYAIAGVLGVVVGGVTVWSVQSDAAPTDSSDPETPQAQSPEPESDDDEAPERDRAPETLTECRQALVRKAVEVRAAQATAARAVAKQLFDDDDAPAGPARSGSTGGADVGTGATTRAPEERQQQRAEWREATTKVHDALVQELGVSPSEEQALSDVVCPTRENERSLFLEFHEGSLDTPGLFSALREERSVSMEGIRQTLGPERFAKLGQLGGPSMLSRTICRRR